MTSHAGRLLRCLRVRRWIVGALAGAALSAVPARADWTVVWEVSRQARGSADDSHPVTVLIRGDRARLERSTTAVILVDGASGRVYQLDPGAKTYTVTLPGAESPLPPGVVLPPRVALPTQAASATLRPGGGTKMVAGRPTREYAATSSLTTQLPTDPSARMPSFKSEGQLWVGEGDQPAPAVMAALLPLLLADEADAGKAQQKTDRKIERIYDLDMESVRRNHAGALGRSMAAMLQPLTEKLAALGRPVLAARLSLSLGPGVPSTDFLAEATSIAEATHAEELFGVPADYRRLGADPGVTAEAPVGPAIPVPAIPASFDRLVGVYSLPSGEVAVTRAGDRLFAEPAGKPREELVPAEGNRFRVGRQAAEMGFFQNAEGDVTHAVLLMQGLEMRAPRVR